jgi:Ca2+-binding EF-hand superfamily protein
MLDTVSKLSQRMKVMGLSLADIFRMADEQYEGQISKAQFLKVVNSLKADIEDNLIQELFYAIDTDLNGTLD